ncbi:hypothetical protein BS78_08G011800 [Paspalum vaginatum]|nr:hypothetical protein BS78_08G011800 [Paspalum vaginatum]
MSQNLAQMGETGMDETSGQTAEAGIRVRSEPSADVQMEPLRFLQHCGSCNRTLGPEVDIYIYKGESAFCSTECREKGMKIDHT